MSKPNTRSMRKRVGHERVNNTCAWSVLETCACIVMVERNPEGRVRARIMGVPIEIEAGFQNATRPDASGRVTLTCSHHHGYLGSLGTCARVAS